MIEATIRSTEDCLGFHLFAKNTSEIPVELVITNPYTSVRLFTLGGAHIAKWNFLTWEQSDPIIFLRQDQSIIAAIRLYPIWTEIRDQVSIQYELQWRSGNTLEFNRLTIESCISLQFPFSELKKRVRSNAVSADLLQGGSGLLNVSEFVTILTYSNSDNPPTRKPVVGMWGPTYS